MIKIKNLADIKPGMTIWNTWRTSFAGRDSGSAEDMFRIDAIGTLSLDNENTQRLVVQAFSFNKLDMVEHYFSTEDCASELVCLCDEDDIEDYFDKKSAVAQKKIIDLETEIKTQQRTLQKMNVAKTSSLLHMKNHEKLKSE